MSKTVSYEVKVNETGQIEAFDSMDAVLDFAHRIRHTFGVWDGKVTFSVAKITRQDCRFDF